MHDPVAVQIELVRRHMHEFRQDAFTMTDNKVVGLFGMIVPREPNPTLVAELRRLLGEAERGEILSAAWVVGMDPNLCVAAYEAPTGHQFCIATGLLQLNYEYGKFLSEQE